MVHDSKDSRILFIGAGAMGGAILSGMLSHNVDPQRLVIQDPSPSEKTLDLLNKYQIPISDKVPVEKPASLIVLAVKPQILPMVLPDCASHIGDDTIVLSIAAGVTIEKMARGLPSDTPIVRAMPNTPAAIGKGVTGLTCNQRLSDGQLALVNMIFGSVGQSVWVDDEAMIDMVTAISGSGPAYLFYFTECLANAGTELGLSQEVADQLARATIVGSGALMEREKDTPTQLRTQVTSPNGTTQAALDVLMGKEGLEPVIKQAVAAAHKRAVELAKG